MTAYENLTSDQKMSIEARLANETKSAGVAYLLWFFLGTLAVHCFYLGQTKIGLIRLVLGVLGWILALVGLGAAMEGHSGASLAWGLIFLAIAGIWLIVDLFRIPSYIRQQQATRREELAVSLLPKQVPMKKVLLSTLLALLACTASAEERYISMRNVDIGMAGQGYCSLVFNLTASAPFDNHWRLRSDSTTVMRKYTKRLWKSNRSARQEPTKHNIALLNGLVMKLLRPRC